MHVRIKEAGMFENFLEFAGIETEGKIASLDEFLAVVDGKTFLDGMYRIFKTSDLEKWTGIVEEAFPQAKGKVRIFGYDWLGRVFAVNIAGDNVVMLEPGTGQILSVPDDVEDFHEYDIAEEADDVLSGGFYRAWLEKNNNYQLKHNECVGYKVPLFLGGKDNVDNLEAGDMEVYWGVLTPLMP